ncbi:unnamed protein product [Sphagnum balticum]
MKRRPGAEKLLAAELEHARRNTDAAGGNIRLMKLQVAASSLDAAAAAEAPLAEDLSKFRIESLAILFDDIGAEASQFIVKKDLQFSIVV